MGWTNPVPGGAQTRGFAPGTYYADAPMWHDPPIRRAHDLGNGKFVDAIYAAHFHAALDIAAPMGVPIYAPQSGLVLDAKLGVPGTWANGGGLFLRVEVNAQCMYLLAHCSRLLVTAGQRVKKGQLIARIGSTGVATGNHTHFWARLGPRPYYDPDAYYWNPALVLPGGPLYNDPRFEPGYGHLPDTGTGNRDKIDGDPSPMRYQSLIDSGEIERREMKANKPIRKGASISSGVWHTTEGRRTIAPWGRIKKEDLPQSERQYGPVYLINVFTGSGSAVGYVKGIDLV